MASNVASSAINSINLRGLVTSGDAFGRGAFGRDAMAGVAAGIAGNAVTVGMNNINLSDANKATLNNYTFDTVAISALSFDSNHLAGSIVFNYLSVFGME